ncbi:YT521-B-like domain-containing protein [Mycena epipterygia]|nr:YT521-B-like domain-containing protein [Mycena epipterygia]
MSGHGRGGSDHPRSDQARSGSTRRQSQQQQRRPPPGYASLNPPPDSPQGYHSPLYSTASVQFSHQPPGGYSGQYMMSPQPPLNMAHSPSPHFAYPPTFHPEQSQSIHAGYPTLAPYSQYSPDTHSSSYASPQPQAPQSPGYSPSASFRYPSPMSPSYAPYAAQSSPGFSPSPPGMYPQHPQHHGQQHYTSPAPDGGTWWYVPSQPQVPSQYDPGPSASYPFYPQSSHPTPDGDEYPASPTYARTSTPSSSSAPPPLSPLPPGREKDPRERPVVRRAYHPNPPAHRSEWVMWAGNVPSDAGHDELWRFFTQPHLIDGSSTATSSSSSGSSSSSSTGGGEGSGNAGSGVLSIFLISRSSCAFINYETEAHLHIAIERFNGVPLRADPRCPRLVCRVRRKDDDLRAGVGGQRGMGMHTRWVKAKSKGAAAAAAREDSASASDSGTSSSDAARSLAASTSALSLGSSDDNDNDGAGPVRPPPRAQTGSNSSGSYASTNSSLLALHFPQRFFILKSLTRDDLDLSVRTGVWATQKHNEGILDRAFRTSKDVFLIFSVNKSGEFYGYARMVGPVGQGDGGRVAWASRSSDSGSPTAARSGPIGTTNNPVSPPQASASARHDAAPLLSADRLVDHSPRPFPTPTATPLRPPDVQSAPALLGKPHRNISSSSPTVKYSLDHHMTPPRRETINLDESAPFRAKRPGSEEPGAAATPAFVQPGGSGGSGLGRVAEEPQDGVDGVGAGREQSTREESWGQDFKLHWICTERLPFQRTRHIRNPWNHDREIKVSRDGTELEPSVGQALLEEWRSFLASEGSQQTPMGESGPARAGGSSGGGTSRS